MDLQKKTLNKFRTTTAKIKPWHNTCYKNLYRLFTNNEFQKTHT